jgi:hypothetical protein
VASFTGLDRPVQRGSGNLERPANFRNGVCGIIIEGLGNTQLSAGQDFGSAAFSPSGSGCHQPCCCPLFNKVSLKLSQGTKDMED